MVTSHIRSHFQNLMKNSSNLNHTEITENLISGKLNEIAPFGEINNLMANLLEIVKVQDEIEDSRRVCASRKHLSALHEQLELM